MTSCVKLRKTVFAGAEPLTTSVTTTVSIGGGVLLEEAVTVSVLSDVRMKVKELCTAIEVVAAEPPSTATTEYATRLWTAGCFGGDRNFRGKAWDKRFKEQSADVTRKHVRRMIEAMTMRAYWNLSKEAESKSTLESRYFRDRGRLRTMQTQMGRRAKDRELKEIHFSIN